MEDEESSQEQQDNSLCYGPKELLYKILVIGEFGVGKTIREAFIKHLYSLLSLLPVIHVVTNKFTSPESYLFAIRPGSLGLYATTPIFYIIHVSHFIVPCVLCHVVFCQHIYQ